MIPGLEEVKVIVNMFSCPYQVIIHYTATRKSIFHVPDRRYEILKKYFR
jgi:hypothetical protein